MTARHGTIVVAGGLARRVGAAGRAGVFLHWLLGFRLLGYDVLFVDWVDRPGARLARRLCGS